MNRLHTATRGIGSWRERLAEPDKQWKREYSAFETAVSWEGSRDTPSGLPGPIAELFRDGIFREPILLLAVAEHKVALAGRGGDSQSDVWALLHTNAGAVSMSVEAKAKESFGNGNETLEKWLKADAAEASRKNRQLRWEWVQTNLPSCANNGYSQVAYQLLHRCASAVIEARRLRLIHAAFVVQGFLAPAESFAEYAKLCQAMGMKAESGQMHFTKVGDLDLGVGWADCPLATDKQVAAVV